MLTKVISGGQTGVDQAALRAAEMIPICTGGWAPHGWKTLAGPNPMLGTRYGLEEHPSVHYKDRTDTNVLRSDATLRIASLWQSPGEQCTLDAINKHGKRFRDVSVRTTAGGALAIINFQQEVMAIAHWIHDSQINVLNVAGNSEQTAPGIDDLAYSFLLRVFRCVKLTLEDTAKIKAVN